MKSEDGHLGLSSDPHLLTEAYTSNIHLNTSTYPKEWTRRCLQKQKGSSLLITRGRWGAPVPLGRLQWDAQLFKQNADCVSSQTFPKTGISVQLYTQPTLSVSLYDSVLLLLSGQSSWSLLSHLENPFILLGTSLTPTHISLHPHPQLHKAAFVAFQVAPWEKGLLALFPSGAALFW